MSEYKFYSIHNIVKIKTNTEIPIPDYFLVNGEEDFEPDIEVIQENIEVDKQREEKTRCGIFFFWREGSSLFIDYEIPFSDAKLVIDNLEGKTKIKFTKAFKKFGKIQKCLEYESKFSDNIDKTYLGRVLFFMFNQVMEML